MLRRHLTLLLLALVFAACGGKNNFQATDAPEFQVEGPGFIRLVMPPDEARTRSQENVVLRNTGDASLTITKLEWVDRPERLVFLGERQEGSSCTTSADCGADAICLTATSTCIATALPSQQVIERQQRLDLEFAITPGPAEMSCPEPTGEVPADYVNDYCGALIIETNATNNFNEVVTSGRAIVYFLDPGVSGDIQVEPSFLEFTNVQPGTTHSQTFSVTNAGAEDLDVNTITVEDNPQYFTIVPAGGGALPLTIGSGQAQVFEVTLTIPENAENYEVFTTMNIGSSAGEAKIAVEITAAAGSAPVIELDQDVLRFDASASQTLTIANTGEATLQINGLNVTPATARGFYTFTLDGTDVTNNFQTVNVPKDQSVELVVGFSRPAGNTDSSVGLLAIAHNDRNQGFRSEVTLLGDEGDVPIARLSPEAFTFLAADGNSETRRFVLRNVGTAALDFTGVDLSNFSTGSNAEFSISPMSGTVQPGGLLQATVSFSGANATPDVGVALLQSNNSTPIELSLRALASAAAAPAPAITVLTQGSLRANAPVNLSAASTTPDGAASNAIWTLLARPGASGVWFDGVGETASFTPDVAGTYTIALTVLQGDREAQTTMDLVVE